jgi:Fe-S cluster assembly protein SufD
METVVKKNIIGSLTLAQDEVFPSRRAALLALDKTGLPTARSEEYKHSSTITTLLEKNFHSLNVTQAASEINNADFLIKGLDAYILVFINGVFSETDSHYSSGEIRVKSMEQAIVENKDAFKQHFAKYANSSTDAFVALNTATWNHGVFIDVKDGVVVSKPIIIHHIVDARLENMVTAARNLFLIGKNSTLTLIEKYNSVGGINFSNVVNEIVVGENSGLTYALVQNDAGESIQFNHTIIQQQSNSRSNCFTLSLKGKLIRNNLHLILDGEGIDAHLYGLYLLNADTIADNHTVVDHRKPNSISNEMYKGIMDGGSKGVFNGKILVRPQAQKTNAFQFNRNIILSDSATVHTKPQLEIWADDVKCSHGCTSGQLDEEALFYLQSRGIGKDIARALLLSAYAGEVIDKISNKVLHTYINELVSERLQKNF